MDEDTLESKRENHDRRYDRVRYIHQVTNPQASVEKAELMREVEQL